MMGKFSFKMVGKKFVEYYSISTGHFLVFKYNGASDFRVLIFDMTACEISYPDEETDDVMLDSGTDGHKRLVGCRVYKGHSAQITEGEATSPTILNMEDEHASSAKQGERVLPIDERHSCAKAYVSPAVNNKALKASNTLKLDHPSFKFVMRSSYARSGYPVPMYFINTYLQGGYNSVRLKVSDGQTWSVRWLDNQYGVQLGSGWVQFVRENNVKERDVCVFELINKKDLCLKFTFSKRWKADDCRSLPSSGALYSNISIEKVLRTADYVTKLCNMDVRRSTMYYDL
ncbi:hypothetical protein IFM89_036768 [Coptis chinensis]|uniref:TF-B3 domain-containing protein n=1 Tax=Coptis chinensis TaxID=261450 RepID=A0A835HPU4_9MAGN|nr:hypothetical protein IFM89_036768 [Coptis chinensis]